MRRTKPPILEKHPLNILPDCSVEDYRRLRESIQSHGFNPKFPVYLYEGKILDGWQRYRACMELETEPVTEKFNGTGEEATILIREAMTRRNMTEDQIAAFLAKHNSEILDRYRAEAKERMLAGKKPQGRASRGSKDVKSRAKDKAAKDFGTTRKKITRADKIKVADPELLDKVLSGEKKLHEVEKEVIPVQKESVKKFNRTTDSIEWARWTWNPVTGCEHGCKYCYARDIAERFYPQGFEPTFHEDRLGAPMNTRIPKIDELGEHNVFVCSMADLFGNWVPEEWIYKVLDAIDASHEWWNFLLLTKNPKRYLELDIPERCWLGASATNQKEMDNTVEVFQQLQEKKNNLLFVSCEPLNGQIEAELSCIDWLIIGGRSRSKGMPACQPEWKWVWKLMKFAEKAGLEERVYWKPNLEVVPKGYPRTKEPMVYTQKIVN